MYHCDIFRSDCGQQTWNGQNEDLTGIGRELPSITHCVDSNVNWQRKIDLKHLEFYLASIWFSKCLGDCEIIHHLVNCQILSLVNLGL